MPVQVQVSVQHPQQPPVPSSSDERPGFGVPPRLPAVREKEIVPLPVPIADRVVVAQHQMVVEHHWVPQVLLAPLRLDH